MTATANTFTFLFEDSMLTGLFMESSSQKVMQIVCITTETCNLKNNIFGNKLKTK
jgi:hypothetical protein